MGKYNFPNSQASHREISDGTMEIFYSNQLSYGRFL